VTLGQVGEITLEWRYRCHTSGSWKAAPEEGGGLLSYYFIHVIALAEYFLTGYHVVECCAIEEASGHKIGMVVANGSIRFTATFCASPADSMFSLAINGVVAITAATPFGAVPERGERDCRIDALKRFYTTEVFSDAVEQGGAGRGGRILQAWADLAARLRRGNTGVPLRGL
jgi:hypothetical protein